jgi:hypothetical protein
MAWVERFWSFVDQNGPTHVAALGACWRWTGSIARGYGQLQIGTHQRPIPEKAHRLSWVLHNGPIPGGQHVLHRCDWPPCCRPEHLFLGTPRINADDREQKGRGLAGRSTPGEANNFALLSDGAVREIRRQRALGVTNVQLAREFSVSPSTISKIVCGVNWSHLREGVTGG